MNNELVQPKLTVSNVINPKSMKSTTFSKVLLLSAAITSGCDTNTSKPAETKTEGGNNIEMPDTTAKSPAPKIEEAKKSDIEEKEEAVNQDPKKLISEIKKKKLSPQFHGFGTEPFWDLYILEKSVVLDNQSLEEQQYWELLQPFDKSKSSQKIYLVNAKGKKATAQITKEECDDGMTENLYKYSVNFEGLMGCGELGKK